MCYGIIYLFDYIKRLTKSVTNLKLILDHSVRTKSRDKLTSIEAFVPFLGPHLESFGVIALNVGAFLYHLHQLGALQRAVLDALDRPAVAVDLPEAVAGRQQNVVTGQRHQRRAR